MIIKFSAVIKTIIITIISKVIFRIIGLHYSSFIVSVKIMLSVVSACISKSIISYTVSHNNFCVFIDVYRSNWYNDMAVSFLIYKLFSIVVCYYIAYFIMVVVQ